MSDEKKVVEVAKETRTVKLQGRQVERLAELSKRTQVLNEQEAKISLEQVKIRAGIDTIMELNAAPGEKAITYNFNSCELLLEKEVKPEAAAK